MNIQAIRIIVATASSLAVAAVILVIFVLPAEFDVDPLGTGKMLGILGISSTTEPSMVAEEIDGFHNDSIQFVLQPFESVEYKYRIKKDSGLMYSWSATGVVTSEFHGEPDEGPEGFAETYQLGKYEKGNGTFTAPFNGIHGWFWENRGSDSVTVSLRSAGFYTATLEFRDGFVDEKTIEQ